MTATSPDASLQIAVFTAISAALTGTTVTAAPAENQAEPYVHIGLSDVSPFPAGKKVGIEIHTWSGVAGPQEIKSLQHGIRTALDNVTLTQNEWTFNLWEDMATVMQDVGGESWHGVQRYRVNAS